MLWCVCGVGGGAGSEQRSTLRAEGAVVMVQLWVGRDVSATQPVYHRFALNGLRMGAGKEGRQHNHKHRIR
jgi:hypothetical protein